MGRKRNAILDKGPVGVFAQKLRDRMDAVTPPTTFRRLAAKVWCSHALLAEACAGKKLPTWQVTEAFVHACGATDEEVAAWHSEWEQTQQAAGQLRRKLGEADVVVPTRSRTGQAIRAGRLRPVKPDLASPLASVPAPEAAQTFDDLIYQTRVLKIAVGNPSLRVLSAWLRRNGGYHSPSSLSEAFTGRRPPSFELFKAVVEGLISYGVERNGMERQDEWMSVRGWTEAWSRAEYNRLRPDLMPRRRFGNVHLLVDDQDEGPTAGIVAELPADHAAALLGSLHRGVAAGIIAQLPPDKAQAIINAMWQQNATIHPDHAEDGTPQATVLQHPAASGDGPGTSGKINS
ncbi:helix-turn-helix domain-containing protein [Nonomuraea sp. NPDC049625]|uniref:helix-turn-helix domain-containing protein n=1 Tax=Nonomuraea sp. NPDC049625 TaxID=3155775 RepID=UPI0034371F61